MLLSRRLEETAEVARSRPRRAVIVGAVAVAVAVVAAAVVVLILVMTRPSGPSPTTLARQVLVKDYGTLNTAVGRFGRQAAVCRSKDDLSCAEQAASSLAEPFQTFEARLAAIDFPAPERRAAVGLEQASSRMRTELQALSQAPDLTGYVQAFRGFETAATTFDSSYQALRSRLG